MRSKTEKALVLCVLAALVIVGVHVARLSASPASAAQAPLPVKTDVDAHAQPGGSSNVNGNGNGVPTAYALAPTGEVLWSQAGRPWRPLRDGQLLAPGDKIRVGAGGGVSVMFAGGTVVRLDPETIIEIRGLSAQGWNPSGGGTGQVGDALRKTTSESPPAARTLAARLYQSAGRIWVHVVRRVNSALSFEVETPAAVAGVRGTIFTVAVSTQQTTVSVWEGTVEVKPAKDAARPDVAPVRVTSRQVVRVEKGRSPSLFQYLTPDEDYYWRQAGSWLKDEEERTKKLRTEDGEVEEQDDESGGKPGNNDDDKKGYTKGKDSSDEHDAGSGQEVGGRPDDDDNGDGDGSGDGRGDGGDSGGRGDDSRGSRR